MKLECLYPISTLLAIWFVHVIYIYCGCLLIWDTQERYLSQPSPELSAMRATCDTISEDVQASGRAILRVPTDDSPENHPSALTLIVSNQFTLS